MKYNRVISTAVLLILLATTLPAFAQKEEEEKGGGKPQAAQQKAQPQRAPQAQQKQQPQRAPQAKAPHQAKAQPQRAPQAKAPQQAKAQPQRAPQARPAVASNRGGGQYGRISNANYTAHFGHGHSFRMGHPQFSGGYNRFQYGGYSFGYNQGWPAGWGYSDDFYVEYINGAYFLCDLSFPGVQITLNIF